MLKLVSFHMQAHLNAFLQILEYFSQICLGPRARESTCILLRCKLLYCGQNMGRLISLTSSSQIKYILLVLGYELGSTQEISTKTGVNNDEFKRFYSLCLLLYSTQNLPLHKQPLTVVRISML